VGGFNKNPPIPSLDTGVGVSDATGSVEKFKYNFVLYLVRDPFRGAEDIVN
jgi:hypothetical protein